MKTILNKRNTRLLFVVIIALIAAILPLSKVEAGSRVVESVVSSPTGYRTLCGSGTPVDFSVVPTEASLDTASGRISYKINIQWKRCPGGTNTRAYAIYSESTEVCPISGIYGKNYWVSDCVKYIGSPAYNEPGSSLQCWGGKNDYCVADGFQGKRVANQPSTGLNSITIPMSTTIPNWSAQASNGSHQIQQSMCQYYKTGTKFTNHNDNRCVTITIRATWAPGNNNSACNAFTGGYGIPAADPWEQIALRDAATGQSIPGKNVRPGQTVLLGVKMKNTGGSTWQGGYGVYALVPTTSVGNLAPAPAPYNNNSVDNNTNPKRVYFNGTVPPGGTVQFWYQATVPSNASSGPLYLWWQMRQTINFNGLPAGNFGDTCSIRLNIPQPTNQSACNAFTGGYGLPAADPGEQIALRDAATGQPIPGKNVRPGQKVVLGVSMKNTGTTTWQGGYGVYALVPTTPVGDLAPAPWPYNGWSVDNNTNPKRVYFNGTVPPEGGVSFWFEATVPSNASSGPLDLTWQMRQTINFNGLPAGNFGDTCSIRLNIPKPIGSTCVPFTGGYGLPAADPGEQIALRDAATGQPIPGKNVLPGQRVVLGVSMKNTGGVTWQGGYGVHALTPTTPVDAVAPAPWPYNGWSVDNNTNPKRVYFNGTVPPGGAVQFWYQATVPIGQPAGNFNLDWRMRQTVPFEGRPAAWFGDTCSITLTIPENRPFLSVGGGDVFSGASFAANWLGPTDQCEPSVDSKKANVQTNGYYTDGKPEDARNNGSSTSQYATFASGLIGDDDNYGNINTFLGNYGYARSSIGDTKDALFANYHNGGDYGKFYNQTPMPCVDITKVQQSSEGVLSPGAVQSFMQSGKGVRTVGGDVSFSSAIIDANGHDKTIIVNGTVTLNGDITYASSFADATKIPHLKIIAHNIYIPSGTQQIDADLVASPTQGWGADQINGTIDTCSDVIGTGAGTWFNIFSKPTVNSCNTGVRFGGSLAARKVFWKRTYGTLGVKNDVADPTCYFGSYSPGDDAPIIQGNAAQKAQLVEQRYKKCAAESIDSNPQSMINFLNNNEQNKNVPTSTVELPPVY